MKVAQIIFVLSVLVFVHELGHYCFARLFKMRVEKFYLFFPPALIKFKRKKSDTEWGLGSIPLGGFCKISGMVDESMDNSPTESEAKPWEFRSKPAWQRFLVLFGGILYNLIFAVLMFSVIYFTWGDSYLKNSDVTQGIEVNDLSYELGFRNGDRIYKVGDEIVEDFSDIWFTLVKNSASSVTVLRSSDTLKIDIDPLYQPAIMNNPQMFSLALPTLVLQVPENSINVDANLEPGDIITKVGDDPVVTFQEVQNALQKYKSSNILVEVLRNGEKVLVEVKCSEEAKLEVHLQKDMSVLNFTHREYTLFSSFGAGFKKMTTSVSDYLKQLRLIITPKTEAYKSVGSIISIGSILPVVWNWRVVWEVCASLSIMLAVFNFIPIPGLDGGHILFTLYEMITRRKPSKAFLIRAQMIGMTLLMILVFLAISNDIVRLFN